MMRTNKNISLSMNKFKESSNSNSRNSADHTGAFIDKNLEIKPLQWLN